MPQPNLENFKDDVELPELIDGTLTYMEVLSLRDVDGNVLDLLADLLFGAVGKDSGNNPCSFVGFVVEDQLARRFGTHEKGTAEHNGQKCSEANHVSPTVDDVGESCTDAIGDELVARDGHIIEFIHPSFILCRSNFRNIKLISDPD